MLCFLCEYSGCGGTKMAIVYIYITRALEWSEKASVHRVIFVFFVACRHLNSCSMGSVFSVERIDCLLTWTLSSAHEVARLLVVSISKVLYWDGRWGWRQGATDCSWRAGEWRELTVDWTEREIECEQQTALRLTSIVLVSRNGPMGSLYVQSGEYLPQTNSRWDGDRSQENGAI